MPIQSILNEFVMMWVLVDPIGTLPVFLLLTAGVAEEHRSKVAVRAVGVAAAVLIFFIVGGHLLLKALGIPLTTFQIAGGIVLFLFALTMVFGPPKAEQDVEEVATLERARSIAVYPLAIPAIASPGAMLGAVLLTDNEVFSALEYAVSIGITLFVLAVTLALLFAAGPVLRVIGDAGVNVLSRIMGLILAAVAVDSVLQALATFFSITGVPTSTIM
jgi:multiple antibiotic resistance protein